MKNIFSTKLSWWKAPLFLVGTGSLYCMKEKSDSTKNLGNGVAFSLKLNDGTNIPVIGLGTYLNGADNSEFQKAVETAIDVGYRHIDTAAIYGTEKQVGRGIKAKIASNVIKREDIYVTTKLWNDKHLREQVVPALKESLQNLDLDYVDLYLIHFPVSLDENGNLNDIDYINTWKGMEEAKKLGLTKSIGVSNFNIEQLERLLQTACVIPVVNQVEVNPNITQKEMINFCKERGIEIIAYSPLGYMPESRTKERECPPKLDDPVLTEIGKKYGKTTVQVVLRYAVDRGLVAIPKSANGCRIHQNIDIFDFQLTPEEIEKIDKFNMDKRVVYPEEWKDSPYFPFPKK